MKKFIVVYCLICGDLTLAKDNFFDQFNIDQSIITKIAPNITGHKNKNSESYDRNADNHDDIFYFFKNNQLVRIEEDNNFDKKIDMVKSFNKNFEESREDTDQNGIFETYSKVTRVSPVKHIKLIKWDLDQDGKFDKEVKLNLERASLQEYDSDSLCSSVPQIIGPLLKNLIKDTGKYTDIKTKGYRDTNFGFQIDRARYNIFEKDGGAGFVNASVHEAIEEGVQCFAKLGYDALNNDQDKSTEPKVFENLRRLKNILSNPKMPVQLKCSGKMHENAFIGQAFAISYSPGDEEAEQTSLEITKPGKKLKLHTLEINKHYRDMVVSALGNDDLLKQKFKQTIFHELLHNLGYKHSEDIDFMYACDTCCHGKKGYSEKTMELSCKICAGDYKGPEDKKYISDMLELIDNNSRFDATNTNKLIINLMKKNKAKGVDDPELKFFLAKSMMHIHPMLGCLAMNRATHPNYNEYVESTSEDKKLTESPIPASFKEKSKECLAMYERFTRPTTTADYKGLNYFFDSYRAEFDPDDAHYEFYKFGMNNHHAHKNTFIAISNILKAPVPKGADEKTEMASRKYLLSHMKTRMVYNYSFADNDLQSASQKLLKNALAALAQAKNNEEIEKVVKTYTENFEEINKCKDDSVCLTKYTSPWKINTPAVTKTPVEKI